MNQLTIWVWNLNFPHTNAPWEEWPIDEDNLATDIQRLLAEYPAEEGFVFEFGKREEA